ncbi:hypothetical protein [Nocardioides sp. HB32]
MALTDARIVLDRVPPRRGSRDRWLSYIAVHGNRFPVLAAADAATVAAAASEIVEALDNATDATRDAVLEIWVGDYDEFWELLEATEAATS